MSAFRALRLVNELNVRNLTMALRGRRLLSPLCSTLISQPSANYFIKNGKVHKYKSEFWMPAVDEVKVQNYEVMRIPLKILYVASAITFAMLYDLFFNV